MAADIKQKDPVTTYFLLNIVIFKNYQQLFYSCFFTLRRTNRNSFKTLLYCAIISEICIAMPWRVKLPKNCTV